MAFLKGPIGWLVAATVACVAIGAAFLPPRGILRESRVTLSGVVTGPPTPERERANELAKEWRRAALDAQLHEWRQRLAPELARLRSANMPTLVVRTDTSWSPLARARAVREVELAWQALELGTTKIGLAVVIEPEQVVATAARTNAAYLLPDSAERHTCVAWSAPRPAMGLSLERDDPRSRGWHAEWARSVLGVCAFYARFGRPSPEIERWLAHQYYRFTYPVWDTMWTRLMRTFGQQPTGPEAAARARHARRLYSPLALGCMAGHAAACTAAVAATPRGGVPARLVIRTAGLTPGLEFDVPGATGMFSDMIREFGTARFARFWIADEAPEAAFQAAMDTTLGDWMVSRQRAFNTTLEAGPAPRLGTGLLGLGVAAVCLLLAGAAAMRRQVT